MLAAPHLVARLGRWCFTLQQDSGVVGGGLGGGGLAMDVLGFVPVDHGERRWLDLGPDAQI